MDKTNCEKMLMDFIGNMDGQSPNEESPMNEAISQVVNNLMGCITNNNLDNIENLPSKQSAIIIGLAWFTAFLMKHMDILGLKIDGEEPFKMFTEYLLPASYIAIQAGTGEKTEVDDTVQTYQDAIGLATAVYDPSVPVSDIVDMYYGDISEEEKRNVLRRLKALRNKSLNTNVGS